MDKVKLQFIKFEIEGNYIILYPKALIDTGSSDTLLGDNMVGQIIKYKGTQPVKVPFLMTTSHILQGKWRFSSELAK